MAQSYYYLLQDERKTNAEVGNRVCFLTENHAMKAYWGEEVQVHAFLTSALD
jgi:hypothetical protein